MQDNRAAGEQSDPVIDPAALDAVAEMVGTDEPEVMLDLLDTFLEDSQNQIDKMVSSLAAEDWTLLHRIAHSLKSSSATFGAMRLSQLCQTLESAAKDSCAAGDCGSTGGADCGRASTGFGCAKRYTRRVCRRLTAATDKKSEGLQDPRILLSLRQVQSRESVFRFFFFVLLNDILGQVLGHGFVVIELDRIDAASLRHRTQVRAVAHDLSQRHLRFDDGALPLLLHPQDATPTRVEVTHHIAHVLVGYGDFHVVDRFQQHRVCRLEGLLEDLTTGGLKGNIL